MSSVASESLKEKAVWLLERMMESDPVWAQYPELKEKIEGVKGLEEAVAVATEHCANTKDPKWVGRLYGGGSDASYLAEMIVSFYNKNVHTYVAGPLFTTAEHAIINKVLGYVGWNPEISAGIFFPGGSYCNLVSYICARHRRDPDVKQKGLTKPMKMITSIYSHYSVDKSAIMMGLGLDSVMKIDFEATSVEEFEKIVVDNNVFCLNSTFGTTSYGNLESVKKFDEVMKKHGVWHHVDACVGACALFSDKYRYLTSELETADSITVDCHKLLNITMQCSCVLVKEGKLLNECSTVTAPYLFHKYGNSVDHSQRSFQCGRKADGFKLWFCDAVDDLDKQATMVYDRAAEFHQILAGDERFNHIYADSPTHICFRVRGKEEIDYERAVEELRRRGMYIEYYIDFFRLVPVNESFGEEQLRSVLDEIYNVVMKEC